MPAIPDLLWLNLSPSLCPLNRPLLRQLSYRGTVAQWDYHHSADDPALLEIPLTLLHDYLKAVARPIHLAGHGLSGVLGLLYAQRYPERVRSLTLLGVGPYPMVTWHSHYYAQRRLLPCRRDRILIKLVNDLFGPMARSMVRELVCRLEADLDSTPAPHSLICHPYLAPGSAPVPLLACGSQDDGVIAPHEFLRWQHWLQPGRGDRLWQCPQGRHFFQYSEATALARAMGNFWQSLAPA